MRQRDVQRSPRQADGAAVRGSFGAHVSDAPSNVHIDDINGNGNMSGLQPMAAMTAAAPSGRSKAGPGGGSDHMLELASGASGSGASHGQPTAATGTVEGVNDTAAVEYEGQLMIMRQAYLSARESLSELQEQLEQEQTKRKDTQKAHVQLKTDLQDVKIQNEMLSVRLQTLSDERDVRHRTVHMVGWTNGSDGWKEEAEGRTLGHAHVGGGKMPYHSDAVHVHDCTVSLFLYLSLSLSLSLSLYVCGSCV